MSDLVMSLLLGLARTTAVLAVAALAVHGLLRMTRASSPAIHRAAWCLVLVQGWLWFRVPVELAWYETVRDEATPGDTAVGPAPPADAQPIRMAAGTAGPTDVPASTIAAAVGPAPPADIASGPLRDPQSGHGVTGLPSAPAGEAGPTPLWPMILAAVWLGGMGLLVAGWLGCYLAFLSLLPRGQRADGEWIAQWEDLLQSRGVRQAIPMRVTVRTGPVLCRLPWGYQLLVRASLWERLDPAGRLSILRHELAHWERGDVWKSLGVRLLALPHWFNPLAWWAVRRFDEAAEWACDLAVCGTSRNARPEYAKALVLMGETAAGPALFRPAAGRGLSQRIRRLLSSELKEDSLMKKLLVLGAALALVLACLIRFDLVAKEPAAENVTGVGPALPAESKPAAIPAGKVGPTDAAEQVARERLTYDGKGFRQWLSEFRRELNPVRRTEAIKALTAFGARGYGKEAAEAIVDAMRDYNTDYGGNNPTGVLKRAAIQACAGDSSDRSAPVIDPTASLPVLVRELKEGPPNGCYFALMVFYDMGPEAKPAIPALAEIVRNNEDSQVRSLAFSALARAEKSGQTTMSLLAELAKGKDRRLAISAVGIAAVYSPGGRLASGTRPNQTAPAELPEKLKPFAKMVIDAVTDKDPEVRHAAIGSLYGLGTAADDAVPALIEVLGKGDPDDSLILDTLGRLGPKAQEAGIPGLSKAYEEARQANNDYLANRIRSLIGRTQEALSPPGGMRRGGRGGPPTRGGAAPAATTRGTPAAPSGKPASGEKKAEPPR